MKRPETVQTMGVLFKEETLQTVEYGILDNAFVLESLEPFPGYHGENVPLELKPGSLFLITEEHYPIETILRISQHISDYHQVQFDMSPAAIFIHNTEFQSVRIKDLNNYALISDIQAQFVDHEIKFMKMRKISTPALIRVDKVFCLDEMQDGFYKDLEDDLTYYIEIPYFFSWNLFKKVTLSVKNNLDNSNFDAAQAFLYLKTIVELVRIYANNPSIGRLQGIRDKYLEEVVRIQEK